MIDFVKQNIAPGSTVYTDGLQGFEGIPKAGVRHIPHLQPLRTDLRKGVPSVVPLADRAIGNLKQWLIGTYHGVSNPQLHIYLDEFVFRHNRRRSPMAAFQTLLGLGAGQPPTPYRRIQGARNIAMDGKYQWNPLAAHWLDSYSLAYTVSSLLNQLFGKGKDPFWQQAYTNLVKWIIELYRIFPDRWVTLRDVYLCAIDPELFKQKLDEAKGVVKSQKNGAIVISAKDLDKRRADLGGVPWTTFSDGERQTPWTAELAKWLQREGVICRVAPVAAHTDTDRLKARYESVKTWYEKDWMQMDPKLRTSCVEGISSFLSLFDMEDVADIFCPKAPAKERVAEGEDAGNGDSRPPVGKARMRRHLPPLDELIESGKVLALNMPAGSNPALARAIGVFLKNAWLQTLIRRPAQMKADPGRYFRPAVFICDEYQSFASVGEEDPSGDEKAFALTRQCRVIPIVATQSISSLRSVLGTSEAWRALLQTLRTRIFLSLSDDASAEIASKLCGQVAKIKPSWTVTESAQQAQVSLLSGRAGGSRGSVGTSKSFREQREALFQPREFGLLPNCQAICLPYDGTHATSAVRVYLKPYYLPVDTPYWRAVAAGKI